MSKTTHLYPTRFSATPEERVARVYARLSGDTDNLYEFTTKLAKGVSFTEIMKRADCIIAAIHKGGFDALFTIGFQVTVKPLGNISYWNSINIDSALGTEPTFEPKGKNRPKRFNHGRDFYAMSAVGA
jgi:hypothetical protein